MAEEKQIQPVVHQATTVMVLDALLPENKTCYENLLNLRGQPDYVRQVRFCFTDPFNKELNSLYPMVAKGEGKGEGDEKTWWEDLRFAFYEAPGIKEGTRLARMAPMGINDSFPGPLGNYEYIAKLNASSAKPRSQKALLKGAKTEISFSDRPITNATAGPNGRSVYFDVNFDFYRNVEKFYVACLCHPDVLTKIRYSNGSLPLPATNKIIDFAKEKRGDYAKHLKEKIEELNKDYADKPKKLKASLEEAQRKYEESVSKIYLDALNKFSPGANHRLRHEQTAVDPKTLPPEFRQEGVHTYNGHRLQSIPQKELFLLDKDSFKCVMDHKLFKEYKNDKAAPRTNKRDFSAGGSKASGGDGKKPWDYYIERTNCKNPDLRDKLKFAKEAGLTYNPLTVLRMFPVPKPGGGVVIDTDFAKWNPDQGSPESFLSPGAFGIPMVSIVMSFNSGQGIPYRMSVEIEGFRHIAHNPVYSKRGDDGFGSDISNEYLDSVEVEDLGALFLPAHHLPLAIEAPSGDSDDDSPHPVKKAKRIAQAQAELEEAEEALARDLEEVD